VKVVALALVFVGALACEAGRRPLGAGLAARDVDGGEEALEPFTPYRPPATSPGTAAAPPEGAAGVGGSPGPGDPGPAVGGASGGPLLPPPDVAPPPLTTCEGAPHRALPYAIAADFTQRFLLNMPQLISTPTFDECVDDCFAIHYAPDPCADPTGPCWAGVLFTPSFFGGPGVCIEPGAREVRFEARASREGARVKFGSIRAGMGTTEFFLTLSTTWAAYSVSIPDGEPYDAEPGGSIGVWNGFSIVVEPQDHVGGTDILVRKIVWWPAVAPG
jgi:hypothetical protein